MIRMFLLGALALSPQQTDTTFAVRAGGTVDIENFSGRVTVRSWDQSRMRVRAQHSANVEIDIETEGSAVRIDASSWDGVPSNRRPQPRLNNESPLKRCSAV